MPSVTPPVHVHGKGDACRSTLNVSLLAGGAICGKRPESDVHCLLVVGRINPNRAWAAARNRTPRTKTHGASGGDP